MEIQKPHSPRTAFYQKVLLLSAGLLLFLFITEASLRLGGFTLNCLQDYRNRQALAKKDSYRILCLGESTTARGYPRFLEKALEGYVKDKKFTVIDKGVPGIDSRYIAERLKENIDAYHPDIVVIMAGINDHGRHLPYQDEGKKDFLSAFKVYKLARFIAMHLKSRYYAGIPAKAGRAPQEDEKPKEKSEEELLELLRDNPSDIRTVIALGKYYEVRGSGTEAEEYFKKAIAISPQNADTHVSLGLYYMRIERIPEAKDCFQRALQLDPHYGRALRGIGICYRYLGDDFNAERSLRMAVESDPYDLDNYFSLAWYYRSRGSPRRSQEIFRRGIRLMPDEDRLNGVMATLSVESGDVSSAMQYYGRAEELRSRDYTVRTRESLENIKSYLDDHGVKMVCVQYPMRNINTLKRLFPRDEGLVFVDNEASFKEKVIREGYEVYFTDMFAGDFGHCTRAGNMLLAENIAKAISEEIFER